ncbi:hypothetical protein QQS21_002064 [Conoideocrella luteorostrata]|uniref:Fungal-type protein kinase domain-containing protein n=1 Tax=Conoideocrella luteorostrata TaxID=1105319 RepID=A0AAJ0CWV1_9HYPO|nr:hypothetical protein QQS21_002064 [Conoideocrella luteorostrata]
MPNASDFCDRRSWDCVQVIGQFCRNDRVFIKKACNTFDILNDLADFLPLALSYQHMADEDLGKSSIIIDTDNYGKFIFLNGPSNDAFLRKLYIEDYPMATGEGIVGAGTTCYRAKVPDTDDWNCVLKFKWRWAGERPENELLNLAKEKCVWGAVSLDYYKELEDTAHRRRGIRWGFSEQDDHHID